MVSQCDVSRILSIKKSKFDYICNVFKNVIQIKIFNRVGYPILPTTDPTRCLGRIEMKLICLGASSVTLNDLGWVRANLTSQKEVLNAF